MTFNNYHCYGKTIKESGKKNKKNPISPKAGLDYQKTIQGRNPEVSLNT